MYGWVLEQDIGEYVGCVQDDTGSRVFRMEYKHEEQNRPAMCGFTCLERGKCSMICGRPCCRVV